MYVRRVWKQGAHGLWNLWEVGAGLFVDDLTGSVCLAAEPLFGQNKLPPISANKGGARTGRELYRLLLQRLSAEIPGSHSIKSLRRDAFSWYLWLHLWSPGLTINTQGNCAWLGSSWMSSALSTDVDPVAVLQAPFRPWFTPAAGATPGEVFVSLEGNGWDFAGPALVRKGWPSHVLPDSCQGDWNFWATAGNFLKF